MIKDILEKHGVYTMDLELELLRHFDKLRNEMLANKTQAEVVDDNQEALDLINWGKQWRIDVWQSYREIMNYRIYHALHRAGTIFDEATYEAVRDDHTAKGKLRARFIDFGENQPHLPFSQALPLIASGSIKVRNIGEKSRQVIGTLLEGDR